MRVQRRITENSAVHRGVHRQVYVCPLRIILKIFFDTLIIMLEMVTEFTAGKRVVLFNVG